MNDQSKTKQVLIQELALLRQRIKEMERSESEYQLTEQALHESEDLSRSYIEEAPDGVYISDLEGNLLYGNRKCEEMIGYRREELIGKNFVEVNFLPEHSLNVALRLLQANLEGKSTGPDEIELITKEGRLVPVEISTNVIQRMGQRIVLSFARDITERKQMENLLRENELRYRDLFDNISSGVAIYEVKDNGNDFIFKDFNKAGERLDGDRKEDVIGKSIYQIRPGIKEFGLLNVFKRVWETGISEHYPALFYDDNRLKKWFENYVYKLPTGEIVAVYDDITDRKQTEEKLRESEANYKQLFDNAPSGIYQVDFRTGKLIKANDVFCEYFGCSQEEITSISPYDIMTEESKKRFFERLNKMVLGEEVPENPEYEIIERDGKGVWVKLTTKYNYDSEGLAGANVVVHDIDDLKRAEEKLKDTLEGLRKAVSTTIQVMVSAVEARDPYTAGHQLRVADLARAIATEMGLPQDTIDGIRMAGSIHDIGKLSIPAEILSKPGKLSDVEFSLIKEHSRKGYEMLKDVESPWPLAEIVYQHHERMDGSGYPRNLKGDEILMEARIMAVADVVEAMASHRPYRPGLGIGAALEEIEKNRGTFYDEAVANACLRLFREKGFQLQS